MKDCGFQTRMELAGRSSHPPFKMDHGQGISEVQNTHYFHESSIHGRCFSNNVHNWRHRSSEWNRRSGKFLLQGIYRFVIIEILPCNHPDIIEFETMGSKNATQLIKVCGLEHYLIGGFLAYGNELIGSSSFPSASFRRGLTMAMDKADSVLDFLSEH